MKRYKHPEPKLWNLQSSGVITSMVFLLVGLLLRELNAFGIVAALDLSALMPAEWRSLLAVVEAVSIAVGVALAAVTALGQWTRHHAGKDSKDRAKWLNWEFGTVAVAAIIEAFNNYLIGTKNTQDLSYLFGQKVTVGVLSIGVVLVWLGVGKVLADLYLAWKLEHDTWEVNHQTWLNKYSGGEDGRPASRTGDRTKGRTASGQPDGAVDSRTQGPDTGAGQSENNGTGRLTIADFRRMVRAGDVDLSGLTARDIADRGWTSERNARRWLEKVRTSGNGARQQSMAVDRVRAES
jgi:hypothetical protein